MKRTRKNKQLNTESKRFYYSKYMSILVGVVCILITIFLANITRENELDKVRQDVKSISEIYQNRVENRIDNIEFNLTELAGYGPPTNIQEARDWEMRTDFYLENLVGVKNIVLFDKSLIIQRANPPDNADYAVGTIINTVQSNPKYTNLILPIYSDDVLAGFILSDIDVTELILLIDLESNGEYMLQVYEGDTLLASSENWKDSNIEISESNEVIFKNKTLRFVLVPTETLILENTSNARLILYFGLCLSALISYIWYSRTAINDRLENLVSKKTAELSYMSFHDQLTGIYNRRYYEMKIKEFEENEVYPFSLILADINGLKLVNDAFGHQEGDNLLQLASKIMLTHVPESGIICRIGGDEFAILLPDLDESICENIISDIEKHSSEIKKKNIQLSISFGIASKSKGENLDKLFPVAEDRMYQSKLIEVPSMRSNAIDTIMQTLNEKDNYSEQHVRNVAILSKRLAEFMKLPISDIKEIHTAGLLHDIGKIIIPSTILNKEGKLTNEEYTIMKSHPEIGFRILNSTAELRGISKIVLHHHERWDGKGYPHHLKGEEISLKSRIITISDAYDAMTTERSYKRTLTKEEALTEVIRCSGTQFDPDIVTVFIDNFEEITKEIALKDLTHSKKLLIDE